MAGGSQVTRLDDKAAGKPSTMTQRLLAVELDTTEFFPAKQFNPASLRTTASAINRAGQHRIKVIIETRPVHGSRVSRAELASGITDLTGAPIDFAAGQRMRKYPFATMEPGDTFTVPAGKTTISALRDSVQRYRARNLTRQYRITSNPDGRFTVACTVRAAVF